MAPNIENSREMNGTILVFVPVTRVEEIAAMKCRIFLLEVRSKRGATKTPSHEVSQKGTKLKHFSLCLRDFVATMIFSTTLLGLFVLTSTASAQLASGRFTTSFYGWQGRSATLDKQTNLRAFENMQFDFSQQQFSFNTNFQVSKDFGTVIGTDPELRLSSLILKARNIAGVADVSLGRQFVFAGVGNGLLDGGVAKGTVWDRKIGVTVYGGYNVVQSRTLNFKRNLGDNSLNGGQVTYMPNDDGIVGLSYMKRTRTPHPITTLRADSLFNPYLVVIALSPNEEEYASVDARYNFIERVNVYARSDYDVNMTRLSRAELSARVAICPALSATAEYLFREPRVAYNSIFSVFRANTRFIRSFAPMRASRMLSIRYRGVSMTTAGG
jgi:hypothetical protein